MGGKENFFMTKIALFLNLAYLSITKAPYLLISISYAFEVNKDGLMIACSIIDILTWLLALPLFAYAHGQGIPFAFISLIVGVSGIASEIVLIIQQLGDRNQCKNPSFHDFS